MPVPMQIFITEDGSPTLILTYENGSAEKMHHSGGALSESFFIYHTALRTIFEHGWRPRILSLGLGLGYNELIAVGEMHKSEVADWRLWSFEIQDVLRSGFIKWLEDSPTDLGDVYDQVLLGVAGKLGMTAEDLKILTVAAVKSGKLILRGSFPAEAGDMTACTCVFYDAFSKKMDPDLWDEPQLRARLEKRLAPQCVLATYAATGVLNRILKSLGFRLLPRAGFLGKRESTLAIRE